ncbi:MAG: alpha-L-fucosidase [Oscillospiraceae bacterium]|nr:alpha-L-fucosidase [Oscillospiraceae bacterium]MDD4368484.1 alpha-L-fucosidase [Oscillospiraceae bacterium]
MAKAHEMTGAELASKLKSQVDPAGRRADLPGLDDPALRLNEAQLAWWQDAKLGLFIHWGVYARIGQGEWAYFNQHYTESGYRELARTWRPAQPAADICNGWLDLAKEAGLKYAVMVTRHHDGYAMWDSQSSWKDFTTVRCGPGEDYVRAYVEACRAHEIPAGLYYSPMDWRFPGYFDPKGQPESAQAMKQQMYAQLQELTQRYGPVPILWFDGGWLAHQGTDADAAWLWDPLTLCRQLRASNPGMLFTPRSGYKGDFQCEEGPDAVTGPIRPYPWEKCFSVSTAWGYRPQDQYMNLNQLLRRLIDTICRDGNLILNVGPDPDGRVPEPAVTLLRQLGQWLDQNGEAVYQTRAGIWEPVEDVFGSVMSQDAIYLHILDPQRFAGQTLNWPANLRLRQAALLHGPELVATVAQGRLNLSLPANLPSVPDTIVKLQIG